MKRAPKWPMTNAQAAKYPPDVTTDYGWCSFCPAGRKVPVAVVMVTHPLQEVQPGGADCIKFCFRCAALVGKAVRS